MGTSRVHRAAVWVFTVAAGACGAASGVEQPSAERRQGPPPPAEHTAEGFSFLAFGDSRLPGYLSFTEDQGSELRAFVEANWGTDDYDAVFDAHGRLVELNRPRRDPTTRMILRDGWPHRMWTATEAGMRQILRSEGQDWVYHAVTAAARAGAELVIHTGDIAYNGYYGTSPATSPYWSDFQSRFLDRLPEGAPEGLPGRFFPALGNHETWMDESLEGLLSTVGYLHRLGVDADHGMYSFRYGNSLFVFMNTGSYPPEAGWGASKPSFASQNDTLEALLTQAEADGLRHVFVSLHKPPFCGVGHGHLEPPEHPHRTLRDHAGALDITVFSGHVHSTEMYLQDGIAYFVLGGGGADQTFHSMDCGDDDPYCQGELYWRGAPREEEYNFMTVSVAGEEISYELSRWRPESEPEYEVCTVSRTARALDVACVPEARWISPGQLPTRSPSNSEKFRMTRSSVAGGS